ncbi:MATE family efflux transporter, partial [Pseudomonas aeruginosa]
SLNLAMASAMRGIGETKTPMVINVFCNFLNVGGNAVLIYGLFGAPALGIVGAGISTAASHVIASGLMIWHL